MFIGDLLSFVRSDELQGTMVVLAVVPVDELLRPSTGRFDGGESAGVSRRLFMVAKKTWAPAVLGVVSVSYGKGV